MPKGHLADLPPLAAASRVTDNLSGPRVGSDG
jgi:hypothetical protein